VPQSAPFSTGQRALTQSSRTLDAQLDALQPMLRHADAVPASSIEQSAVRVVEGNAAQLAVVPDEGSAAAVRASAWNEFQKSTRGQFASRSEAASVYRSNQLARAGVDPDSISAQAQGWQGSGRYYGVDRYRDITLREGTIIFGGVPGQSAYYTTPRGFERYGDDATALFQGLQVGPYRGTYRPGMTAYRVTRDVPAAFGITRANPQFGAGGAPQVYLPGYEDVLEPLYSVPLTNTRVP
jgi:hypothetical protein